MDSTIPTITQPAFSVSMDPNWQTRVTELPNALTISRREQDCGYEITSSVQTAIISSTNVQAPRRMDEVRTRCALKYINLHKHVHKHLYTQLQHLWDEHVARVMDLSEINMWRVFSSVRRESKVCQSAVLASVRSMVHPLTAPKWPKDRRQLDRWIKRAGGFYGRVLRSVTIEVCGHVIPFRFLDPVYAWTVTAMQVSRKSVLYFKYRPRYNNEGQRMYGTSVTCGEVMQKACARINSM